MTNKINDKLYLELFFLDTYFMKHLGTLNDRMKFHKIHGKISE